MKKSSPASDFDHASFWGAGVFAGEALKQYTDAPLTDDALASVEASLRCRLPRSYVELARVQNGGIPHRNCHATRESTSWAEHHVALHGIFSIGASKPCSLGGEFGSAYWVKEWGYPDIGVYFADCPSAGHDMFCLDYTALGTDGEPPVVHIDQGMDYRRTLVSRTFGAFVRGLRAESDFEPPLRTK